MSDESLDLKRRDFIKIGLAAGLVAGIPTGILPGPGTTNAFAKVGTNTRGIAPPTIEELEAIAKQYYLNFSRGDLRVFQGVVTGALESYRRIADLEEPKLPVKYPRESGYRPSADENPLNAWYWRCSIK